MNTLTKNRILESGDEYLDRGTWKPVPQVDIGMQIMFTKYAEVRRPSEAPPKHRSCIITQRNDFSGAPAKDTATSATPIAAPTAKAALPERKKSPLPLLDKLIRPENITLSPPPTPKAKVDSIEIVFPKPSKVSTKWIGRNGTFNQTAINLLRVDGRFRIVPSGVRGMAKNAQIEFPAEIIPQLTDWLLQQQLEGKLTK